MLQIAMTEVWTCSSQEEEGTVEGKCAIVAKYATCICPLWQTPTPIPVEYSSPIYLGPLGII